MIEKSQTTPQEHLSKDQMHEHIQAFLKSQHERRIELKRQKAILDEETKNPEEKIQVIEEAFNKHSSAIEADLEAFSTQEKLDRPTVNLLWDSLADLRDYYAQVSFSLTSYNQWTFKKKVNLLEAKIQELSKKIPRTKFRFRRKKKKAEEDQSELAKKKKLEEIKHSEIIGTLKGIEGRKGETIEIGEETLDGVGNFKIFGLEDCTVRLKGRINSLFINKVKNCQIWTCPVSNSIMIHEANDCHLRIIGHQIRLHDSYDTRFDVFTTSRLIIENCKRVKFGEFGTEEGDEYQGFENDMEGKENLWKEVQDFHWIKQEKSPNFELIGVEQEEMVESEPKESVEEKQLEEVQVTEEKKEEEVKEVKREVEDIDEELLKNATIMEPAFEVEKEKPQKGRKKKPLKEKPVAEEQMEEKPTEPEPVEDDDSSEDEI